MDTFKQILRGALFFVLAVCGMTVAFIFMLSSALAVAVLYVVARVKRRPFGAKAYWAARRPPRTSRTPGSPPSFSTRGGVIDVKMREL